MSFLWHHALWLLLAVPGVIGAYLVLLRRRHTGAVRYAGLARVQVARGLRASMKAQVPALLMLGGVTILLLSAARPAVVFTGPSPQGTVILLIDVSLSMAASDVAPTRLAAAQAAAKAFVEAKPRDVRIGVVAFGGYADVVQAPTADGSAVIAAIERLELQRFTAIGNGLMGALLALFPTAAIPQGYDVFGFGQPPPGVSDIAQDSRGRPLVRHKPVAPGSYHSAAIILVSDGKGTMGVPAAQAAKLVADYGIRVYTIGVGTLYGGVANVEGWPAIHAEFAEETLEEIAQITHGEYFLARNGEKVRRVYEKLGRRAIIERTEHEVTALFAALGIVLSLAAAALSLAGTLAPRSARGTPSRTA